MASLGPNLTWSRIGDSSRRTIPRRRTANATGLKQPARLAENPKGPAEPGRPRPRTPLLPSGQLPGLLHGRSRRHHGRASVSRSARLPARALGGVAVGFHPRRAGDILNSGSSLFPVGDEQEKRLAPRRRDAENTVGMRENDIGTQVLEAAITDARGRGGALNGTPNLSASASPREKHPLKTAKRLNSRPAPRASSIPQPPAALGAVRSVLAGNVSICHLDI